ncbi:MAG: hypothetical protein M1819_006746 [Sarea resinae]|nr:MAG: hypothetical protein M1819_006746 [Sarea resinae]
MVLLTMTPAVVAAIQKLNALEDLASIEPTLKGAAVNKPISHNQIIDIARRLRQHGPAPATAAPTAAKEPTSWRLSDLLRGSAIYIDPPKPKPEPTPEYKALMARLRREEESREYERMISPPPPSETFAKRFPSSTLAHTFPSIGAPPTEEDDEITYADVNRQMTLILNVLISIIACSIAIWLAARHWSTPSRLGLSMGGAGLVGVAEVVVYAGYLGRVKEAKERTKKQKEKKEVVHTWVIEGKGEKVSEKSAAKRYDLEKHQPLRQRKAKPK